MKKNVMLKTFLCLLSLTLASRNARAENYLDVAGLSPSTHYQTFNTEHFHFVYQDGYLDFTKRAAVHFEHAHQVLSPLLKWKPRARTDILIADNQDDANGFTSAALRIGIVLIATPPDAWFSTSYSDDWIKLLVFHEYTHFLNMDPTTGWMEALRILFGDVIRPNGLWPIWMLEGLAVYIETHTTRLGRGRSPYYDSIVRAYLDEGRFMPTSDRPLTLDRVNGDYPYFPGGEVPYLFGYHLWNQFSKDHSNVNNTDAAMGDYSLRSSSRIPYFIEGNLENVMKKNWDDYWNSFVQESQLRLGSQIEQVKALGETPHEIVTNSKYASLLGAISPNGEWLAYSQSSLDDRSRLVLKNIKSGEERKLEQKILGLGMDFSPDSRYLIYSSLQRYKTYYLYSDIMVYDLETGKTTQVTHGLRAKDPSLSADG
ncbi:MAG: hypothetical protein H7333_02470, partial [Bdellovibrionales bacterium]|nr:hypothetical protein [Oligoflexia bacterium]